MPEVTRTTTRRGKMPHAVPDDADVDVAAELRLRHGGHDLAGERRIALLAALEREGSLTRAAKSAGLSYKGAWDALEQMGHLAGEPLAERAVGGRGGGSTRLTARGVQLLRRYERVAIEHARFLARVNAGDADDAALPRHPALRTSARNQFAGTVVAVRAGRVNDEVELAVIGGLRLVATITRESTEALSLVPGRAAFALVKASSISLAASSFDRRRNRLAGTVDRMVRGAADTEVVLALPGGGRVAAVVTPADVKALGLKRGDDAVATFEASSVILGVAD